MSARCMYCALARSVSAESRTRLFRPFAEGLCLDYLGFSNGVISSIPTLFSLFE